MIVKNTKKKEKLKIGEKMFVNNIEKFGEFEDWKGKDCIKY